MRLGAPIFETSSDPQAWVEAHRRKGYSAAYCPDLSSEAQARDYAQAAQTAGLVIAEVGAWSNPLSLDEVERKRAIRYCRSAWLWPNGAGRAAASTSPARAAPSGTGRVPRT